MHFMKKIQVFLENNIIVNLSKKKTSKSHVAE